MVQWQETGAVDWTTCTLVEVVPGKVSGVPILKETRVQADSIVENYEGGSPVEEISENFAIPERTIQELLASRPINENSFNREGTVGSQRISQTAAVSF